MGTGVSAGTVSTLNKKTKERGMVLSSDRGSFNWISVFSIFIDASELGNRHQDFSLAKFFEFPILKVLCARCWRNHSALPV